MRTEVLIYHPGTGTAYYGAPPDSLVARECIIDADPTKLPNGTVIQLPNGVSTVHASGDFETYSEAGFYQDLATGKIKGSKADGKGGLPVVGTPNYTSDLSAEALCFFYDLKDGEGRRGWIQGGPNPLDLFAYIEAGGIIEAWNVTFELWVWNQICVRVWGWPPLQLHQCRCVMARSRRYSLPGALGKCSAVLGTMEKDKAGYNLIQKLTRPHTPTKNRPEIRWTTATAWPDFLNFYQYCDTDVEAEDRAAAHIPDLTPYELDMWLNDQTINLRGVQVDVVALDAALEIERQCRERYNTELFDLTGGKVKTADNIAGIVLWCNQRGARLPDGVAETVTEALERDDLTPEVRRALEIRDKLGAANVKKLKTLKLQVSSDGRLRDQYTYCGADRTGRASAGGVQLQNITAKGPKTFDCEDCGRIFGAHHHAACPHCGCFLTRECADWTIEAVQEALGAILTRDLSVVEHYFGDAIEVLCGCLRGLFIAAEGKEFKCVDFSAVEAVVAACLSRCQWRIDVFNTHGKIYEMSAAKISGIPFDEIVGHKERTGKDHPLRKSLGKVAELASGYGGWIGAWLNFGAGDFMDEEEIKAAVLAWRAESPEIVEMWGGQFRQTGKRMSDGHAELYGLEGAVVSAIQNPGETFTYFDISYFVKGDVLFCRLPSGRHLNYHRPKLVLQDGKWGKPDSYKITFEGYNSNSQKGAVGWFVLETYGGRLFENVVQAVAADLQFEALGRCERAGYSIVMHTHDEGTAETDIGWGSLEEMTEIMIERPHWASWWPIRGSGWRHKRYQK